MIISEKFYILVSQTGVKAGVSVDIMTLGYRKTMYFGFPETSTVFPGERSALICFVCCIDEQWEQDNKPHKQ